MKKRIVDPLPPPTGPPEPLEENIVHGVKFDDIKFGWSTLSSRLSQAYSHLVLVDEEGNPKVRDEEGNVIMREDTFEILSFSFLPLTLLHDSSALTALEFHRAMFELEQGISIAGCPEAAAVNRVLGIALQIRLSEDPLAIFELEEMKRETIRDLMQMIAYERELYGSERPRRGTGEPGILKVSYSFVRFHCSFADFSCFRSTGVPRSLPLSRSIKKRRRRSILPHQRKIDSIQLWSTSPPRLANSGRRREKE